MLQLNKIIKEIVRIEFEDRLSDEELLCFEKSLLKVIRNEFRKMANLNLEIEDLISQVYFAIKEAKSKYDASKNLTLIQYTNFLTKRRIIDYVRYFTRDKRQITLMAMNAFRSGVYEDGQTLFEKDIDSYSCEKNIGVNDEISLKNTIMYFIKTTENKKNANIAKCIYLGYSPSFLMKKLKVTKSQIDKVKNDIKNLYINFNNSRSNI